MKQTDTNTDRKPVLPLLPGSQSYALYFYSSQYLHVAIPKKKGSGFLKSALGGHHANKNTMSFIYDDELRGIINFYHTTDVDGYLYIKMVKADYMSGFEDDLKIVLSKIKDVWCQITDFKHITADEFWNVII